MTGSYKVQRRAAQDIATELNQVEFYKIACATDPSIGTLVSVCCSPYLHMYVCSAKRDWVGRKLINILVGQFSGFSRKYFLKAIKLRLISINESRASSPNQTIRDGDILRHLVLRHEPRTFFWTRHASTAANNHAKALIRTSTTILSSTMTGLSSTSAALPSTSSTLPGTSSSLPHVASSAPLHDGPIALPADTRVGWIEVKWFDNDRVLVANKPPGIPVHPCGAYHHHTVTQMLATGRWYSTGHASTGALESPSALRRRRECVLRGGVHALHRLDRLVGGVLLLCADANTARDMAKDMCAGDCDKIYVARVSGKFPARVTCCQPIRKRPVMENGATESREPLRECHAGGQSAKTVFALVRYMEVSPHSRARKL